MILWYTEGVFRTEMHQWKNYEPEQENVREIWRTCHIAAPEENLIETGSWNKPFEEKVLMEG